MRYLTLFFLITVMTQSGFSQDPKKEQKKEKTKKVINKRESKVTEIPRSEFEKLPKVRQEIILNAPDYKVVEGK